MYEEIKREKRTRNKIYYVFSCQLDGCGLEIESRQGLFRGYYGLVDFGAKRTYLINLTEREVDENGKTLYRYYVNPSGQRLEVCKTTFKDTFDVKNGILEGIQQKITNGEMFVTDGRGRSANPSRTSEQMTQMIIDHINSFPQYENHYSRRRQGDYFLSPDLTISKMFRAFLDANPNEPNLNQKETIYRRIFRETGLSIGAPKSDTCRECDRLHINLTAATTAESTVLVEGQINDHHLSVDVAYSTLNRDLADSKVNPAHIVICGDLQQVLFCPTLTHSDMFYKRQLTTYNYCLYDGASQNGTMCVWSEVLGRRGVNEVASCLYEKLTSTYQPLERGARRKLTFWSDRCRGQVNNYPLICTFKLLIRQGYFDEVEQKFLCTGHSFLPCDRMFALIEKVKKTAIVYVPDDWIRIFQESRIDNPFPIQPMTQQNIFNFKSLVRWIPKPQDLKVTEVTWIRLTDLAPDRIRTKASFDEDQWTIFTILRPFQRGPINNREEWTNASIENFELVPAYDSPIPIPNPKRNDLLSMLPYLLPEFRLYYENLLSV